MNLLQLQTTMNTTPSIIVDWNDEGLYWLTNDKSKSADLQMDNENGTRNANLTNTGRNEALAQAEICVLGTILCMALLGNLMVIVVLMYRKRKLSRMKMFIIHLAVADISVALFQVLPQLVMDITFKFDGNNFLCKLVKYMQVGTMYSSTYVLIMTALDRYMSICDPLNSQTWTTKRICHVVWVSVNAKETHNAVKRKTHYRNGSSQYNTEETVTNPRAHSKKMSKSKIKTVKLTLTVVICFIVCWAPFFITQMWAAFDMNAPYFTSDCLKLLASLNSCTNPWIYLAFSDKFCKTRKPTTTSTANTYLSDSSERDHLRLRQLNPDNTSLSMSRSFNDQ
ncbi:cephalotocin receptor 1-like [Mya arenaria]|uniref:cephalotocin receptor 1-like n=1 Tax=Mya arenaria TaxID=6604 RepID=UPI0022DEDDC5|nr:cephalotocin receptor 1-like [Mya arenaria]